MLSTTDFSQLPNRKKLQQICKAISVLDAILYQDWEYRYYSYDSKWAPDEEFCGMRDGEGDEMLILFRPDGCIINGMAHEHSPKDKTALTQGLPAIYNEFISGEPVHSIGTTFCLWTDAYDAWQVGSVTDPDDGSADLLSIFDGDPQTYIDWAEEYYEDGFIINDNTLAVVTGIYEGKPVTKEVVLALTPQLEDWEKLKQDMEEIDYPYKW